jgi:hypothetical protein
MFALMLVDGHNQPQGFPAWRETSIYPQATALMMDRPEYTMGYITVVVLFPKQSATGQGVSLPASGGNLPATQETTHATAS